MLKFLGRAAAIAGVVTAMAFGCAKGTDDTGSGGAQAAPVATGAGGMGGQGGQGGTGGQGGAGLPCGIDCGTIKVADTCHLARCDVTSHTCEVIALPDGQACDDGQFCTIADTCSSGMCMGGGANTCDMGDPGQCHVISCDEMSHSCSLAPGLEGTSCLPDDKCQIMAKCSNGVCVGQLNDCLFVPPPDACHVLQCDPKDGQCKPQVGNNGMPCNDPVKLCLQNGTCQNGVCAGTSPLDCSFLSSGCQQGVCDMMFGFCTTQALAKGSKCPDATDACNQGLCDANANCVAQPFKDGTACAATGCGQTCMSGKCTGAGTPYAVKLTEPFDNNNGGWTMQGEWAIGPAKASNCSMVGSEDPAKDHTGNAANGVAGVVIGGCANTNLHDWVYLTSPAVDVSQLSFVFLNFWRFLNSDFPPFMVNRVDVYDGANWQQVWQSSDVVMDPAWTQERFDISQYKNNKLQVRFGFKIGSMGVSVSSQWNLDDVVINGCP